MTPTDMPPGRFFYYIADGKKHPVFVHDDDGTWNLYLGRIIEDCWKRLNHYRTYYAHQNLKILALKNRIRELEGDNIALDARYKELSKFLVASENQRKPSPRRNFNENWRPPRR